MRVGCHARVLGHGGVLGKRGPTWNKTIALVLDLICNFFPICAKKRPRFWAQVVVAGVYPADMDYRRAYTRQFINKRVGLDRRPQH